MGFARWIAVVAGLGVGNLSGVGCADKMVAPPSSGAGVVADAGEGVVADAGEGVVLQDDAGEFGVGNGPPGVVTVDDAAAAIDPSALYSVSLTTDTFTVPPNQEVYKCQDLRTRFRGKRSTSPATTCR